MIELFTKSFLEFLKLTPRYLIALVIVAAILLFSPESILKNLAIFEFTKNYRPWLSFILLISFALLVVTGGISTIKRIQKWWRRRKFNLKIIESLNLLTEDEKQILRFYIAEQTKTNTLRFDDGIVNGLVSNGIIYRSASVGTLLEGSAHNISELAWNYLNIHPHILEGTTNSYRTDKRKKWYD